MFYGYCRKSTEQQQETSFEVQATFLKEQAEKLNEQCIIYTETGSGGSLTDRPVFLNLLSSLKKNDIIACYDQSRISRNDKESFVILDAIMEKKARLQVNGKFINPNDPQDRAIFGMQSIFANYQKDIQLQKSREGIKQRFSNGDAVFAGDTFGYLLTKRGKTTTATIIEEEAKVIRYVYKAYSNGVSLYELQNELYGMPFQRPWNVIIQNLRPLLSRPIYMGYYLDTPYMQKHIARYSRTEVEEHLVKSNIYPPIIEEELWWEVFQKYRTVRQPHAIPYENRFTKHALSGIFKCPGCNKGITFKNKKRDGKTFTKYIFQSHTPNCPYLHRTEYDKEWLERAVRACFFLCFLNGSEVGKFFNDIKERFNNDTKDIRKELNTLESAKKKLDAKKQRLVEAVSNGLFSMEDIKNQMESLNTDYKTIEMRKNVLDNQLSALELDVADYLENSAEETMESFPYRERDYYLKYIKEGWNRVKYLELTFMNGKRFIIHKPRHTSQNLYPGQVDVYSMNGDFSFSFHILTKMEIDTKPTGDMWEDAEYHLFKRWEKQVNKRLATFESRN